MCALYNEDVHVITGAILVVIVW